MACPSKRHVKSLLSESTISKSSTTNIRSSKTASLRSARSAEAWFWLFGQSEKKSKSGLLARAGRRGTSNHCFAITSEKEMTEIPELTDLQFARAIPARVRKRLMQGKFESGDDIAALRRFVGLTQVQFARAMGISVHTLRNWEQGRRSPEGSAIALLRIAARHPRIIRENLQSAA
jgi:DNA-binding transcriptional regulator YiaG